MYSELTCMDVLPIEGHVYIYKKNNNVYTSPDTQPPHISIQPYQQNTGLSVTRPLELLVMEAL